MKKLLGENGFLAAETAMLAFLLLFIALSLAALERSAALLAQSEAESSAMFLAEGELAWAERQAMLHNRRDLLPKGRLRSVTENGKTFSMNTTVSLEEHDYQALCQVNVRVSWSNADKEQEFSLTRTVHIGE